MKRYEVCARGYAWLAERESADGLWVKYDEAAAECDELRQQLTKANTMLLFTRAERDSLQHQLAAAQERERWIPASEAPPKNGPYLILFKGKVVYATFLTNGWYQGYYANSVVPDAWRELPAPPEEAADAE
jgi:hypothetical protein